VDLATHKTASGVDFYTINPKGNVPTLVLDDGTILNEGAATLQWIADQKPGTVAPAAGTTARYVNIAALNYVASEAHPGIGGLFNPTLKENAEAKAYVTAGANKKLEYLNKVFATEQFLGGSATPTIADFYLYIVLSWTGYVGLNLDAYANVKAYFEKIKALPAVASAHALIAKSPASTQ